MNKYTGEITIKIAGTDYPVCFNWRALSKVKSLFTDAIWSNLQGADPEKLAEILEIGINKPEVTKDFILDHSPPLISVVKVLDQAVGFAYFGPDGVPEATEQSDDNKKKDSITEAFKTAFYIGISPDVFWSITPWQFSICAEAYKERYEREHDHSAWFMWHGAALTRTQKMPPLNDFMAGKKPIKGVDENAIMARLKAYQKRYENEQ